jgi:proline dehydrogenase
MAITITHDQRDVLYLALATEISYAAEALAREIDPPPYVGPSDLEEAQQARHRIEHDCRLMDDLGWAHEDDRTEVVLTTPRDVLEPVVQRVLDDAEGQLRQANSAVAQELDDERRNRIINKNLDVVSACREVLSQLEAH